MHFRPLSVTVLRMKSLFKHVAQCVPRVKQTAHCSCHTILFGLGCNVQRSQKKSYQIFGDYYTLIVGPVAQSV